MLVCWKRREKRANRKKKAPATTDTRRRSTKNSKKSCDIDSLCFGSFAQLPLLESPPPRISTETSRRCSHRAARLGSGGTVHEQKSVGKESIQRSSKSKTPSPFLLLFLSISSLFSLNEIRKAMSDRGASLSGEVAWRKQDNENA